MEINDLLNLFDREQRIEIEHPGTRKEVTPHIVRFLVPAPETSFILYSKLDETNADAIIDEQAAYFRQAGIPVEWKVYAHDQPLDLRERLKARGFIVREGESVMVLDLEETPLSLLEPVPPQVRRLEDRSELGAVKEVLARVWDDNFDWVDQRLGEHMQIPGYLSVYLASVEGRPASVGWVYFHTNSQFASLWAGSTLKEHRGRGLYTAVLAARVQEALRRGYRYLVIDAGPESKPIVERHGFRVLTEAYDCEWNPPSGE